MCNFYVTIVLADEIVVTFGLRPETPLVGRTHTVDYVFQLLKAVGHRAAETARPKNGREGEEDRPSASAQNRNLYTSTARSITQRHMAEHDHNVDRGQGNGSGDEIEDMYDGEEYQTKDQRSPKRTTYYESDIYEHCTDDRHAFHMRRAMKYQEGQQAHNSPDDSRESQNLEEDKRRLVGAICSQLEMTPAQKERVRHLVLDVVSVNSFGRYSTEKVILSVVNIVAREDGRLIAEEDQFMEYMIQVDLTTEDGNADMKTMKRLREMVRKRIPSY